MNNRERADYVAIQDFEYGAPFGIYTIKTSYKIGDVMRLRVHGKMAAFLLARGRISRVEV